MSESQCSTLAGRPLESPAKKSALDALMRRHIEPAEIAREADLAAIKWTDYRDLHPVQATIEFIGAHYNTYVRLYRNYVDYDKAPFVKIRERSLLSRKNPEFIFAEFSERVSENLTFFWHGRQIADALGMPYGVYVSFAIETRLRNWKRRYLPQPNQTYSDEIIKLAPDHWAGYQAALPHR